MHDWRRYCSQYPGPPNYPYRSGATHLNVEYRKRNWHWMLSFTLWLPPSKPMWASSKSAHWFKANISSIKVLVFIILKPMAVSSLSVSLIIKSTNFPPVIFITWHSGNLPYSLAFLASARFSDLKGWEVLQTVAGYTLVVITFSISMHFMLCLMLFMSFNWK